MAYTWKKVVNDTPIRYNPLSGDVTVEGGSYYSLVAVNTDANSDSRKYGYTEKRIDFYSNKDDSKLDGDVVQVLIEATDSYIEGKKLTYILENHDPGDSGTAEVQGNPVIWEADSSTGNLRWWWEDSATGEKDGEIELLLTFYEYILDCSVTYFDIPEGGAIEETEDHKFAVEWDSVAVGSNATPYDPSGYTENKTVKIVAKGHLAEDSDLSYVTFEGAGGGPGKEEFDGILATPVGNNMPNIYKNNDTNNGTIAKLATEFEEKVPGELYYAKGNTITTNQEVWIMGIYNPDYDTYGFYMSPAQYAGDSPGDYGNWKAMVTATMGGNFSVSCPSDSTISEVWYNPDDNSAIVIPTMYVQETYCSTATGGVDLYGSDGTIVRSYAPMAERNKNLDVAPEKYSGGGAAGGTYVYSIIDDYYAYLSDAELDGEPTIEPTINYKYATEWYDSSIGDDVSDYDETVHPNTTKLEVSEKKIDTNTGLNVIGLIPSGGGDLLYYCYVACETNKDGYVHAYINVPPPETEDFDNFLSMLDSANSGSLDGTTLKTSAYLLFGAPSYFSVLTDDGTANKNYTDDDWTKVTDYCYAMRVRYNKNFAGYYNIIMIYNPSYGRWCRWAQEVDESHTYKPMVTYAENNGGHDAMIDHAEYEYIDTCDGSRIYWHEELERVIVLPDETTNAALIAAGFNLTWYTGWSDTELGAAVTCPWITWENMIDVHDETIEDNFMGMLDRVTTRPTK